MMNPNRKNLLNNSIDIQAVISQPTNMEKWAILLQQVYAVTIKGESINKIVNCFLIRGNHTSTYNPNIFPNSYLHALTCETCTSPHMNSI